MFWGKKNFNRYLPFVLEITYIFIIHKYTIGIHDNKIVELNASHIQYRNRYYYRKIHDNANIILIKLLCSIWNQLYKRLKEKKKRTNFGTSQEDEVFGFFVLSHLWMRGYFRLG